MLEAMHETRLETALTALSLELKLSSLVLFPVGELQLEDIESKYGNQIAAPSKSGYTLEDAFHWIQEPRLLLQGSAFAFLLVPPT